MNKEDFYIKLKTTLEETTSFPTKYLFKFIVPNIDKKILQVEEIFNHLGAVMETKPSKNGNYISISIHVVMKDASQIIEKYREAEKVEGIISL